MCMSCPAGSSTNNLVGATSWAACVACPAGKSSTVGPSNCLSCIAGRYGNSYTDGQTYVCSSTYTSTSVSFVSNKCSSGMVNIGTIYSRSCFDCPSGIGMSPVIVGATSSDACNTVCPRGRYNLGPGMLY